jgi:Zn-dependent protease with chaperone function
VVITAILTWAGIAVVVVVAAGLAHGIERAIRQKPDARENVLGRYAAWRFYHLLLLIGFYTFALYILGWGWSVQRLSTLVDRSQTAGDQLMLPGSEVLLLAPFLAGLLLSWTCFYGADRALQRGGNGNFQTPFWSRRAYVVFHLRNNLGLVCAPLLLMMAQRALRWIFCDGANEWVGVLLVLGLLPAAFVGLPVLLRPVLGLRPMPEGPLHDRLRAAGQRLNFRCKLFLWNTHGRITNAMVVGVVPALRYVLLTDRLVAELTPEEVEAVFGHEVGHVKHHHILFYVGFLLASVIVVFSLWNVGITRVESLRDLFPANEDWTKLPFIGMLGAYIFVVFGFLSRRCERQADVFGCRAVSCARPDCQCHDSQIPLPPSGRALCATGIRTFIEALEKVAQLNDISRKRPGWLQSWQHSTIARRVEFLQAMLAEPIVEQRFQRRVFLMKCTLALVLTTAIILLVWLGGWNALQI